MPDQRAKCDRKIIPRGHVYKVSAKFWLIINYSVKMTHTTNQNSYERAIYTTFLVAYFVPTTF